MAALSIIISGNVQGVGYRSYTLKEAYRLGVRGEVWNRTDGGVEAIAESDPATLESFMRSLRLGPGSIENVTARPIADQGYRGFDIVYPA